MVCKKCNNQLNERDAFCPNCGEKVEAVEQVTAPKETPAAPQKRSKAPLIVGIILGSVFLFIIIIVVLILLFTGILFRSKTITNDIPTSTETTTPSSSNTTTPTTTTEKTTVIGNDEYGYLSLPGTWYKFYDVSGTKSGIQYTKDTVWIVSMDASTKTSEITAENLAKTALYNMKYGSETVQNATGAKVKVRNYNAYQVYGYYPNDNIWLVEWFFEPGDGKVHYISVEGNDYTSDYFKIPDSFSLSKIN